MKLIKNIFYICLLLVICSLVLTRSVIAAPPTNFQTTQIIGSGLNGPSGFEIAPDGRIFILEREGTVKVFKNGQLLPEPFAILPSIATGDRGLIGIAFDPDFSTNNHVYFYYTGEDSLNRLVRFNAEGDVGTDGPFILYETEEPSNWLHVGGSIRFGPDGKIYFAVGDNGYPPNAQNLSNAHGKILRINKDGTVPEDNPFVGQPNVLSEIYAYGMRNPWRFQFDSETGKLYGGDVGDFSIEEVNHIEKGKNYGWPICEGVCDTFGMANPIYDYPHADDSAAVTGGPVYRADMFPSIYYGKLFFADYAMGFIKTLTLDENGNSLGVNDFDVNAGSVVDLKVGPDGSLYYITYYPGRLYRISYSEGNHIPVANAGADKTKGADPLTVNFTSAGSIDPNEDPITYFWAFGDGTNSTEPNPQKTFTQKGTYTVQLTVSDGIDNAQAIPIVIQVGLPPELTIAAPVDNTKYKAGDTIQYQATALDAAGFDLDDGAIVTDIVFHHDTHIHSFINGRRGRVGEFTIPNQNHEPSANTWYEIKVTVTDESGLATTKSVNIYPKKSKVTLKTVGDGLQLLLDGVPHASNYVFEGVAGYLREISANFTQTLNGITYQFSHWSNGNPLSQIFETPEEDTTLTAYFEAATGFNAEYFNNANLEGVPIQEKTNSGINFDWGLGSPDSQINNDNFSVRWTGTQHFPAGKYKFTTTTDDGVKLYVDGNLLIDQWHPQSSESHEGEIELTSGNHQIIMEYFDSGGNAVAKLIWSKTEDLPQIGNISAQYFNNKTLEGAPILERMENDINFDWVNTSPDPSINSDEFSARFIKTDNFAVGDYEFNITADDGVRFYIDDELILSRWVPQNSNFKVTKFLAAGDHTLKIEYYENFGDAKVKLNYLRISSPMPSPSSAPSTGYKVKFWNTPGQIEAPAIPLTDPTLERFDSEINFNWGSASPDPLVNLDDFVAVWEKQVIFESRNYKFKARADDGIRIYIDNTLVLDEWHNSTQDDYEFERNMTAGSHDIKVEYYENEGESSVSFDYEVLPTASEVYSAEYFNNKNLEGIPVAQKSENGVNFEWNSDSPDPLVNLDEFSARFKRLANFQEGGYKFYVTADDGFRLYVDNELILDQWILQTAETHEITRHMTTGNHEIKIEYFENFGDAVLKFNMEQTSSVPTSFKGEYFANRNLEGEPVLTRDDARINFNWFDKKPDASLPENDFSIRWTKEQYFAAGNYSYTLKSDDGARVYIDDQLFIDDWSEHALSTKTQSIDLTEGTHTLRIEYFDAYDNATISFRQN